MPCRYRLLQDGIGSTQGSGSTSRTTRFVFLEMHLAIDIMLSNQKLAETASFALDANAICLPYIGLTENIRVSYL